MKEIFLNPYFKYFVVTIITTLFSVFVKAVSRNDRHIPFKKEDLAVGLELSVTALILLVTDSVKYTSDILSKTSVDITTDNRIIALPWLLFFLLVGLWSISTLIRKKGWKSQDELTWAAGIIIPGFYGLITLIIVINWIK